jgi:hypothetical protein
LWKKYRNSERTPVFLVRSLSGRLRDIFVKPASLW